MNYYISLFLLAVCVVLFFIAIIKRVKHERSKKKKQGSIKTTKMTAKKQLNEWLNSESGLTYENYLIRKIDQLEKEKEAQNKIYLSAVKGRKDFREALQIYRNKEKENRWNDFQAGAKAMFTNEVPPMILVKREFSKHLSND